MAKAKEVEVQAEVVDSETGEIKDLASYRGSIPQEVRLSSWDEVAEYLNGDVVEFESSAYEVVEKSTLVGVPFIITGLKFWEGRYGRTVTVFALTEDNRMILFNDGSTGVYNQLSEMVERTGRSAGIVCRRGLRSSTYTYVEKDFDGNPIEGRKPIDSTTYYVA